MTQNYKYTLLQRHCNPSTNIIAIFLLIPLDARSGIDCIFITAGAATETALLCFLIICPAIAMISFNKEIFGFIICAGVEAHGRVLCSHRFMERGQKASAVEGVGVTIASVTIIAPNRDGFRRWELGSTWRPNRGICSPVFRKKKRRRRRIFWLGPYERDVILLDEVWQQ